MKKRIVSVIMGSDSDLPIVKGTIDILKKFNANYEVKILSAHRTPDEVRKYVTRAGDRGIKVIIAAAGGAAHLAGVIASHTVLPVIGIPIETRSLKGLDSLLSTVQMPGGVPVATVAIGKSGAKNAALLALQILAIENEKLSKKISSFKKSLAGSVKLKNRKLKL